MQFDLSDEQKLLADSVCGLLADLDAKRSPLARFNEGLYADATLWPALRELGVCGSLVATEAGGLGDELLTLPMVQQTLAVWLLSQTDADDAVVAKSLDGGCLAAFALCEPGDCWEPQQWQLSGARLSGEKSHVIGGAEADLFIVGLGSGQFGLVDARAAGLSIKTQASLDRTRPLARLRFEETPYELLTGPTDLAARLNDALLVWAAADACGAARRAVDLSVEYAKTRRQFDRVIGSFQAVKHQLANMAVDAEPCRAMVWYAAHAWDRLPAEAAYSAALAKAHVADVAVRTVRAAVEIHGGLGFTWEYPLHLWLKRAMFSYAFMGSVAHHRARAAEFAGW
jgi:alkylation response protein AidB-like acyl-CoA dehydrogenase